MMQEYTCNSKMQVYACSSCTGKRESENAPPAVNLCRVHEALSPNAHNLTDHRWWIGELLDAALAVATPDSTETAAVPAPG
jgi:hypothetical protein